MNKPAHHKTTWPPHEPFLQDNEPPTWRFQDRDGNECEASLFSTGRMLAAGFENLFRPNTNVWRVDVTLPG